jgi:hypothetical protein
MAVFDGVIPGIVGAANAAGGEFQIDRSLRFNSADSSKLSRTPSSASNRKTWTMSYWVKRAKLSTEQMVFSAASSSSDRVHFYYESTDNIAVYSPSFYYTTNVIARDPGAWQHLVFACDTTQSTDTDRFKIYVNSVLVTSFVNQSHPSQNLDTPVSNNILHQFSGRGYNSSNHADVYLAEINFVDGQQLAPTDFGEYDEFNNWNPKAYSGTYGTNGFHLDFSDTSDLGADAAGSNDWTPNNLSGTAPGLSTANQGFDVVTYTGNGGTQSISSLAFQPDLVWIKARSATYNHYLVDQVRGFNGSNAKVLQSNLTNAEESQNGPGNAFASFDNNGFTVKLGTNNWAGTNQNNQTYVAWCWKAGGAAVSNTDGTLTSQVSASDEYGFSIVKWTGQSSGSATVGHGLSTAPKWIIVKGLTGTVGWTVGHESIGWTKRLQLNTNAAESTNSNYWNDTAPTSSVFTSGANNVNNTFVAYCWSEVPGFSKFDSYSGTGSAVTVTTGFKPRYILVKSTSSGRDWLIWDAARGASGGALQSNTGNTAYSDSTYNGISFNSDGFTIMTGGSTPNMSASGETYIYAAFAAKPDGSIIDSLIDTPTNYDDGTNVGGNYATLNPLNNGGLTLANGNLDYSHTTSAWDTCTGTIGVSSGKYYWEVTVATWNGSGAPFLFGIANASQDINAELGQSANSWAYLPNGQKRHNGSTASYGASLATGDVVGIALDMDNGTLTFYKNGSTQGQAYSSITGFIVPAVSVYGNSTQSGAYSFNAGQRSFQYTPPTDHLSLCTTNLPNPTIADGSTAFDIATYTGNGTTNTAITGLNHSPDLLWIKSRSSTQWHFLADTIRGNTKNLASNAADAEETRTNRLLSFDSNGFTIGNNGTVNENGASFVAWAWDGASSNTTISAGGLNSSAYLYGDWTSMVTGNYSSAYGWGTTYQTLNAFDGNLSTMVIPHGSDGWKFEPTTPIAGNKIEIRGWNDGCPNAGLKINGNNYGDALGPDQTVGEWYTLPYSTLESIELAGDGSAGNTEFRLQAIRIDGRLLIQNNQSPPNVPSAPIRLLGSRLLVIREMPQVVPVSGMD